MGTEFFLTFNTATSETNANGIIEINKGWHSNIKIHYSVDEDDYLIIAGTRHSFEIFESKLDKLLNTGGIFCLPMTDGNILMESDNRGYIKFKFNYGLKDPMFTILFEDELHVFIKKFKNLIYEIRGACYDKKCREKISISTW